MFIFGIYLPHKTRAPLWQIVLWCLTLGRCGALHKVVYRYRPYHPPHINCRCVIVKLTGSMYEN